jgi:hypothetical protein
MAMWLRQVVLGVLFVVGGASPGNAEFSGSETGIEQPTTSRIRVCHGFGCKFITDIDLTNTDRARLARIMAAGSSSAAAERKAIGAAASWFDKRIAPAAGTKNHQARAGIDFTFSDTSGQFDCIDASRNMTRFLTLLARLELLKHHSVGEPVARGYLIDLRMPHATAVLVEKKSGTEWSVDAWVRSYGQAPEIMPLSRWRAGPSSLR